MRVLINVGLFLLAAAYMVAGAWLALATHDRWVFVLPSYLWLAMLLVPITITLGLTRAHAITIFITEILLCLIASSAWSYFAGEVQNDVREGGALLFTLMVMVAVVNVALQLPLYWVVKLLARRSV